MPAELIDNAYGKAAVRLVQVDRGDAHHRLRDLTVELRLRGDFAAAYERGDNRAVLPTDTMRNTVYALARRRGFEPIEALAAALAERLLEATPAATEAEVEVRQHAWEAIATVSGPHPHAFVRPEAATRRALVRGDRAGLEVSAGFEGLRVLKTTDSGFSAFLRDEHTTLEDADDRLLATDVSALWRYRTGAELDYEAAWRELREALLERFAEHHSLSVQHTLSHLAEAAFAARPEVSRIHLRLPNVHHLRFDLERLGLDDPEATLYVATEAPYGVIEGTFERR